ncbi:hypothetical protein BDY17DRAFT_112697 [Neohortaea acidophila]|uniref:Secreted protein n=1 Tax=Neohortaea acidophila TaxID=245834 RepID=A0A6A6Q1K2_9PEZI|nr:uncharacterized protein BDY17DRAFT_112697 [Neohortaea acidophila]KAF2485859.1 hypothetical protein BDY17DRAFT_112697 [Neohortaea acidophila]
MRVAWSLVLVMRHEGFALNLRSAFCSGCASRMNTSSLRPRRRSTQYLSVVQLSGSVLPASPACRCGEGVHASKRVVDCGGINLGRDRRSWTARRVKLL